MEGLRYRTIAQENPRGKQKVFFVSHPDDFVLYFEQISKLILGPQDCAIWYTEECSGINLDGLEGMQLIVIPVTSRFLNKPNDAKDKVFRYSQDRQIPYSNLPTCLICLAAIMIINPLLTIWAGTGKVNI